MRTDRRAYITAMLARQVAALRSRAVYRGRFAAAVDPQDDLLHYALADNEGSAYRAHRSYFDGGRANAQAIEDLLAATGPALREARSVLEFAAGYGRVTRHLVPRVGRSRVTVSDVDRRAVDFVTATLGVDGFYSTEHPGELVCEERYELIVVVSLFSHLPEATWAAWMRRLLALLEPGGSLLFSTLSLRGEAVLPEDREGFARGFLYKPHNETRGRLSVEQYGTAVQSPDYVARAVREVGGELVGHRERALDVQDAYVVRCAQRS